MERVFQQVYTIQGTLAANHTFQAKMPFGAQLVHVSLSNTSANAGTLKIGKTGSAEAYLAATNFGTSSTPAQVTRAGFVGGQYPNLPAGDELLLTVTDHGSHMANVCVVLTFTEG